MLYNIIILWVRTIIQAIYSGYYIIIAPRSSLMYTNHRVGTKQHTNYTFHLSRIIIYADDFDVNDNAVFIELFYK